VLVAVPVLEGVLVPVLLGVGVFEGVLVDVPVLVLVTVPVLEGVLVLVLLGVGVLVGVGVLEGVLVLVLVGVGVFVAANCLAIGTAYTFNTGLCKLNAICCAVLKGGSGAPIVEENRSKAVMIRITHTI